MKTPFLAIRFVILALVGYLSVLSLALAAWNIGAARAAGTYAPSGAIFLIFNACLYLVSVALAFFEYVGHDIHARASLVITECVWSGLMSILLTAASITATLGGPPLFCQPHAPFSLCASATVIVPVSWLAGILMLSYFLTIIGLSVGHMHNHPGIWSTSLYSVPWFETDRVSKYPPRLPPVNRHESARLSFLARRHSLSVFPDDVEQSAGNHDIPEGTSAPVPETPASIQHPPPFERATDSTESTPPWWARVRNMRPGIDLPFTVRFSTLSLARTPRGSADRGQPPVPPTPLHDTNVNNFGQQYSNFFPGERRPSQRVPDSVSTRQDTQYDLDRPLPRPPRSEWVRADGTASPGRPRYGQRF